MRLNTYNYASDKKSHQNPSKKNGFTPFLYLNYI